MFRITLIAVLTLSFTSTLFAQALGEELFTRNCIACHSGDGSGKTSFGKKANIPDLRSPEVQNQTEKDLFASIGRGVGHKEYPHAFLSRGMTPAQINSLVSYIRTLKK